MIWVAWRQHRVSVLTALGAILLVAGFTTFMRFNIVATLEGMDARECMSGDCPREPFSAILRQYGAYIELWPQLLFVLPFLLGILVGAPLFTKEISSGSHMFSLTQSVSRNRWWAAKLTVTAVPLAVGMLGLGLYLLWALWPVLDISYLNRLEPAGFEAQGVVMAGYALFALAVASGVGLLLRNSIGAIVVTAVVCAAVAALATGLARPSYMETVEADVSASADSTNVAPAGGWRITETYTAADGTTFDNFYDYCNYKKGCGKNSAPTSVQYHPGSRFWPFQGIETAAYLVLAGAALTLSSRSLRRLP